MPREMEHTVELRCMSCNEWLTSEDVSCGLSQLCRACCLEPDWAHVAPDDGEERER